MPRLRRDPKGFAEGGSTWVLAGPFDDLHQASDLVIEMKIAWVAQNGTLMVHESTFTTPLAVFFGKSRLCWADKNSFSRALRGMHLEPYLQVKSPLFCRWNCWNPWFPLPLEMPVFKTLLRLDAFPPFRLALPQFATDARKPRELGACRRLSSTLKNINVNINFVSSVSSVWESVKIAQLTVSDNFWIL